MAAYYNEFDPKAAAWLRELIKAGLIADGEVDERSITDVQAGDIRGFDQCHFFAGIGGWSYALRLAGIPDDYPVWTGSCPCQPFSAAGKNAGKSDERHLWPEFARLIAEARPVTVFGEQVEGAVKHGWLDDLQADLEREGYSVGAAVLGAHSVGSYHQRQRLYWVAHTASVRCQQQWSAKAIEIQGECAERTREYKESKQDGELSRGFEGLCGISGMEQPESEQMGIPGQSRQRREADTIGMGNACQQSGERDTRGIYCKESEKYSQDGKFYGFNGIGLADAGEVNGMFNTNGNGCESRSKAAKATRYGSAIDSAGWSNPEWVECRDNKLRPIKPGLEPLAHGVPARVVRLRGYGNAIVPQVAAEFISAFFEVA